MSVPARTIFGQLGQPLEDLAAEPLGVLLPFAAGAGFVAELRLAAIVRRAAIP